MNILQMSISASVLILAVILIRSLALYHLPKRTFMTLWAVVLCRLLIPFSIPSHFSIYSIINPPNSVDGDSVISYTGIPIFHTPAMVPFKSVIEETTSWHVSPLTIIWIVGLLICALCFLGPHLRYLKLYKTALPIDNIFLKDWKRNHTAKRRILIRQSDQITTPLTYGVIRPIILLPKSTQWKDETQLGYILTHEYIHIRYLDTLTKQLLAATLCIHWFNPFVWMMYILANRDIELACDESVIKLLGTSKRAAYALTLLNLAEEKNRLISLASSFSKNAIEERIISIMKTKKITLSGVIVGIALFFCITVVFATSKATTPSKNPVTLTPTVHSEDTVLHYPLPGTPGNHSGYTDSQYTQLMTMKTDDYRQMITRTFRENLIQNSIDWIYSGYNPNDENVAFLKTLGYSLSEVLAESNAEFGQSVTSPSFSISTASNKRNTDGKYYGAALEYTVFWTETELLTVGERDDVLNSTMQKVQQILEQKTQSQICDIGDLQTNFRQLEKQMSNTNISITLQIDSYKAAS